MTSFRFPLEKVLRLRYTQLELEEARFRRQAAELATLDRALAEMEASAIGAEADLRAQKVVTGRDLAALGGYRMAVKEREEQIVQQRDACRRLVAERQAAMMEARRRFRLLEKLKERRLGEWEKARDRELEEIASESFLARWSGR